MAFGLSTGFGKNTLPGGKELLILNSYLIDYYCFNSWHSTGIPFYVQYLNGETKLPL